MIKKQKSILKEVQAGILKAHGKDYVKCIFIKLNDKLDEDNLIDFFSLYSPCSAYQQKKISEKYKLKKRSKKSILNIFFSRYGFEKLGYTINLHAPNPPESESFTKVSIRTEEQREGIQYWKGMRHIHAIDNDPPIKKWEDSYVQNLDMFVTLAGNDIDRIKKTYEEFCCTLNTMNIGTVIHKEQGKTITKIVKGKKIHFEPFGYRDGISKIKFFKNDKLIKTQLPLVVDKHYGSYLVFRKLHQDVNGFDKRIRVLAGEIAKTFINEKGVHPHKEAFIEFVEGQVMGRFKNGVPISLSPNSREKDIPCLHSFNNFNLILDKVTGNKIIGKGYNDDKDGAKCPIHAHIRLANPRTKELLIDINQPKPPRVIIRRSIPYKYSKDDQGLLFMCFQRDLISQFIAIQENWFNAISYGGKENLKVDPIVGTKDASSGNEENPLEWNNIWGKKGDLKFSFSDFVTLKGGEFFYAPPLSFFKKPMVNKIILEKLKDF